MSPKLSGALRLLGTVREGARRLSSQLRDQNYRAGKYSERDEIDRILRRRYLEALDPEIEGFAAPESGDSTAVRAGKALYRFVFSLKRRLDSLPAEAAGAVAAAPEASARIAGSMIGFGAAGVDSYATIIQELGGLMGAEDWHDPQEAQAKLNEIAYGLLQDVGKLDFDNLSIPERKAVRMLAAFLEGVTEWKGVHAGLLDLPRQALVEVVRDLRAAADGDSDAQARVVIAIGALLAGEALRRKLRDRRLRAPSAARSRQVALTAADEAKNAGRKRGVAAGLDTGTGTFTGLSNKAGGGGRIHPEVQRALDSIPPLKRSRFHVGLDSGCAEPRAISEALYAGVDVRGSVMTSVLAGGRKHGLLKPPCASCKLLLKHFGILDGAR